MLMMCTEQGVGLCPPRKGRGICWHSPLALLPPAVVVPAALAPGKVLMGSAASEPNIMCVLSEWSVELGTGGGGHLGSQEGYPLLEVDNTGDC